MFESPLFEGKDELDKIFDQVIAAVAHYGLDIIGAIILLIVGWTVAGWAGNATSKLLSRNGKIDATVAGFASSTIRWAIIIFTVVAALEQFGVETTSFVAVLGALGLAVGFALQGTLGNVASGLMLLIFRPFKAGDYVEIAGTGGTIVTINLFSVEIVTPQNVQIIIPNGAVWGTSISNFSFHETRRVDLEIGIAYEDDIGTALAVLERTAKADDRVLGTPEPAFLVAGLGASSVDLVARLWVKNRDFWPVTFDLRRGFKESLDEAGITIPYPQHVIHQAGKDS